ncbi:MAG: DUF4294 domain-containing protein [Rikenellaceae bacterium]|jgi:hypothetical protein|nr:DUF4294 domain-containing protein [Rikenellaceae bacterium]
MRSFWTNTVVWGAIACLFLLLALSGKADAQTGPPPFDPDNPIYRIRPWSLVDFNIENGDTVPVIHMKPLHVFRRKVDLRRYERMIRNLKIVYPIAQYANWKLHDMEIQMAAMSRKEQGKYAKSVEKELKAQYTPILKRMSFSQGKMLIKLIDRETGNTSYELVRELRGTMSAFLWQGVARLFGANLKDTYDKEGDDQVLEKLIILYEAGQL